MFLQRVMILYVRRIRRIHYGTTRVVTFSLLIRSDRPPRACFFLLPQTAFAPGRRPPRLRTPSLFCHPASPRPTSLHRRLPTSSRLRAPASLAAPSPLRPGLTPPTAASPPRSASSATAQQHPPPHACPSPQRPHSPAHHARMVSLCPGLSAPGHHLHRDCVLSRALRPSASTPSSRVMLVSCMLQL